MTKLARVVVGIDGEDGGWEALALARRLARPDRAALTVVCAYPAIAMQHAPLVWPHIHGEEDAQRALAAARRRLGANPPAALAGAAAASPAAALASVAGATSPAAPATVAGANPPAASAGVAGATSPAAPATVAGATPPAAFVSVAGATPGAVLQRIAVADGADLVVVGSSRRAALGRVLGGDVVAQTLADPPCAVAVAPRGLLGAVAPLAHIGVAVDGTPESLAAVRWAGELTRDPHAVRTLELIHIDEHSEHPKLGELGVAGHLTGKHRFETFAALRLVGRLRSSVLVTWTDATGEVVPALAACSRELDLLVLGTHGRGRLGRLLHGGVAADVGHCALCPVVAVPVSGLRESTVAAPPLRRMPSRSPHASLMA